MAKAEGADHAKGHRNPAVPREIPALAVSLVLFLPFPTPFLFGREWAREALPRPIRRKARPVGLPFFFVNGGRFTKKQRHRVPYNDKLTQ